MPVAEIVWHIIIFEVGAKRPGAAFQKSRDVRIARERTPVSIALIAIRQITLGERADFKHHEHD
jgi:hypothetical protein